MTVASSTRRKVLPLLVAAALTVPGAVLAQDTAADPLPGAGSLLEPGRYASTAIGPALDFRVGDGWVVGEVPEGPILVLERPEQPGTVLTITRFEGDVYLDSCDSTSLAVVEPTVPRLAAVIAGNPFLLAGPPQAITIDGYSGVQLDIGVPAFDQCRLPFLLLLAVPIADGWEFIQVANQQSRFLILDVDGDVLLIAIESYPGVPYGGFLDTSMEVAMSMRITPSSDVQPDPSPEPSTRPLEDA